jgi:hypothetical protein
VAAMRVLIAAIVFRKLLRSLLFRLAKFISCGFAVTAPGGPTVLCGFEMAFTGSGGGLGVRPIMSYGNRSSGLYGGWLAARVEQKTEEPTGDKGRCGDGAGSSFSCRDAAGGVGGDLSWKTEEAE